MILDARESRDHQLSRAPKIIRILRLVFAGDDFEKEMYSDKCWKSIDFDRYHAKKIHAKCKLNKNKTI